MTLWQTPSLPLLSFGDTVPSPLPECHVLFEWPLILKVLAFWNSKWSYQQVFSIFHAAALSEWREDILMSIHRTFIFTLGMSLIKAFEILLSVALDLIIKLIVIKLI